jgi:hypothetical protein
VGSKIFTVNAKDKVNNVSTASDSYYVLHRMILSQRFHWSADSTVRIRPLLWVLVVALKLVGVIDLILDDSILGRSLICICERSLV